MTSILDHHVSPDFESLLTLEKLSSTEFRGYCHAGHPMRAFGGQVAAQALTAAGSSVPSENLAHSLHGYFLSAGDPTKPIVYEVERLRDGRSYRSRRVTARQGGEPIFTLSASFKLSEDGADRQLVMPEVPPPEDLVGVAPCERDVGHDGAHVDKSGEAWGDECHPCWRCLGSSYPRMVLCATCGNKRCPKAADHSLACTNSNAPGQPGSAYP